MTNLLILKMLHADLEAFAAEAGGKVSASGTFVESLDLLAINPTGFLAIIEWQGEEAATEDEFTGVMRNDIGIYVAINAGTSANTATRAASSPRFKSILDQHLPGWPTHCNLLNRLPVRHEEWGR